jgi:hypothetical protein
LSVQAPTTVGSASYNITIDACDKNGYANVGGYVTNAGNVIASFSIAAGIYTGTTRVFGDTTYVENVSPGTRVWWQLTPPNSPNSANVDWICRVDAVNGDPSTVRSASSDITVPPQPAPPATAGSDPSDAAKVSCGTEGADQIAQVLGIAAVSISTPVWADHIYTCDYVYPQNATMTVKVKELSTVEETTAYYEGLAAQFGKNQDLQSLGEGAFSTKSGSVVVRKGYRVLLVDTSGLPPQFGLPADTRENDAINVAYTIVQDWTAG